MAFSFDRFTRLNSLSKTLRFELRPVGKTLDKIKESGVFEHDMKRAAVYPEMKRILDEAHKKLLQEALLRADIEDWSDLEQAYEDFRRDNSQEHKKKLENVQQVFRKKIVEALKKHPDFANLTAATPSDFIKKLLQQDTVPSDVEMFDGFATYLNGFQENRKNIYSVEAQATSAANRAINENFPKFMMCVRIFGVLGEKYPEIIDQAENELRDYLNGRNLKDVFKIGSYGRFLPQTGIDDLNTLIGGVRKEGLKKIRGINEFINLYKQQNEDAKNDKTLGKMPQLYKQILSDRESFSFIEKPFETDEDVINAVNEFGEKFKNEKIADKAKELLKTLMPDDGTVFVDAQALPDISCALGMAWNGLENALREYAENKFSTLKTNKQKEKAVESFMKKSEFSLAELSELPLEKNVLSFWNGTDKGAAVSEMFKDWNEKIASMKSRKISGFIEEIKAFLDSVQDMLHWLKPLNAGQDLERNASFYADYDELYAVLDSIVPLYNRVRNYVTKKPSESVKIKLMFDRGTLANGWDENKEKDNLAIIFEKDDAFFLGIVNSGSKTKPDFKKLAKKEAGSCYRKMVYKQIPNPSRDIIHVMFSKKGIATYKPDSKLLERYKRGDYKKSEPTFDLDFCHELIDFFKRSIESHPDWKKFGFSFSDTASYQSIDEFYNEVSAQGYKLSFENIAAADIDDLVERGDLFLFQIWNKDFSENSVGRPNLHTLYWRALFSPDNLKDLVFKLNGGAELFWRKAAVDKPVVHKTGEKMVNRRDKDGKTIPEGVHDELYKYVNGRASTLSDAAREYRDKIIVKDVKHDIVKDKRFTQDKFLFHVPLTINPNVPGTRGFNERLNKCLADNMKDVRFIGIDRGERHLIYLVMTDAGGKILLQKTFNMVETVNQLGRPLKTDYHQKLDDREKERDKARKSWKTIGKIKDLKEGYLSQVVHEIARLIVENNAVVFLEDLNFGFKRGRFCIEKQVYQKFEKALIEKLNYLVFKDRDATAAGGLLNGYQLTEKFESFKKLGKQTGVLFYIPAAYTSKIDPTTGFSNLFNLKSCSSAKGIKEFFSKFDSITYDARRDAFAFAFDYGNFKTGQESFKKDWTVYSASRRLVYDKQEKAEKEINPTAIIKDKLREAGAVLTDGYDLKAFMSAVEPSSCTGFFKSVFYAFERTLQMRNSRASTNEDYIESPVLNKDGEFFDSRKADASLPHDADANGAYHIALKGICALSAMKDGKMQKLDHKDWFMFAQRRHL